MTKRFRTAEKIEIKRCRLLGDRKPCIVLSRFRSGTWEFSARLLRPLWDRCSTAGITSRLAAPYERSLSVMIRLGGMPAFFSKLMSSRLAAFVSRRLVENIAILINGTPKPVLSAGDGNHHLIQMPEILARRSPATKFFLHRPVRICDPIAGSFHTRRQFRAPAAFPRQGKLSGNLKYSQTAFEMICRGKRWRLRLTAGFFIPPSLGPIH